MTKVIVAHLLIRKIVLVVCARQLVGVVSLRGKVVLDRGLDVSV
jgi:hypothetical protein